MARERLRPGQIHIPHRVLQALHVLASAVAIVVVLLLALDRRYGWLQHSPGGDAFDLNEQPWFMAMFAVGALLAIRWQLLGGAIATFTAATLVVFATRQLRPFDAILVLIGFIVPAVLWLVVGLFELRDERFHRSPDEDPRPLLRRRDVLGGMAFLGLTTFGGVRVGQWLFNRIYGPTHPESRTRGVSGSPTRWVWSGAVTATTAAVTTRLEEDDIAAVQLHVGGTESLANARTFDAVTDDEGVVRIDIDGLAPDTRYYYAFVVDGEVDRRRIGRFRTQPLGASSFSLAFAGCARTGSNGAVFDTIRTLDPQMVIIQGDLHYADIARNTQQAFRQILDHQLSRPGPEALFQSCPVAYVWDDHDFGGNDATSPSRPAAMATYRQFVPHYPLASADSAIYQAFTVGRVRVLLTDARSARQPGDDDPGEVSGTMLGADQKRWLFDELIRARDTHALTIWVNPVPWIATPTEEGDADDWGGFPRDRAEIADFIAANDLARTLLMVSGDAHMVAIDDGTNTDYSDTGQAAFPLLHSSALDRPGSIKGGPYSHGAFPGGGQFGMVSIDDDGTDVIVSLSGRNWRNETLVEYQYRVGG